MKNKLLKIFKNWFLALIIILFFNYIIKYGFKLVPFSQMLDSFKRPLLILIVLLLIRMLVYYFNERKISED